MATGTSETVKREGGRKGERGRERDGRKKTDSVLYICFIILDAHRLIGSGIHDNVRQSIGDQA